MTHHELLRDLASDLRLPPSTNGTCRWVTMHASLGSQWLERGCPEADVMTVRGSHTKQEVAIYEVKANRADWLKEMRTGKWQSYLPFCHRLLFATPRGLIKRDELPPGCGWITRRDEGGWSVVVAGERREDTCWSQDAYSLMCGLLFSIGNQECNIADRETRRQRLAWAVDNDVRKMRKILGQEVADRIRQGDRLLDKLARDGICPLTRGKLCTANAGNCARLDEKLAKSRLGEVVAQWQCRECWDEYIEREYSN